MSVDVLQAAPSLLLTLTKKLRLSELRTELTVKKEIKAFSSVKRKKSNVLGERCSSTSK